VAVLHVGAEVHKLRVKVEQNSADIRDLSTRMAVLSRLEERVAALEKFVSYVLSFLSRLSAKKTSDSPA
jgi:hypothetical protein